MNRKFEVDAEALLCLLKRNYIEEKSLVKAICSAFSVIQGTASIEVLFEDISCLLLATNNGSLYTYESTDFHSKIFASERYILKQLVSKEIPEKCLDHMHLKVTLNAI